MKGLALMSAAQIWGKAWPILIAVLFFGLLIFFHELGHFTFAKIFKVKVNEFAMGMGPTLFKFKKGETKYALRLFPIGGFVSMEGEDENSENENAFCNKPAWQRFIIVAAGGLINLLMGVIIVAIMLSTSEFVGTPVVNYFAENAVSSQYGLQAKDRILEIDGRKVYSDMDVGFLMSRSDDGVYDFVVKRDGKKVELNVWLSLLDLVTGRYGLSDLSGPIGTVSYIAEAVQEGQAATDYSTVFLLMALIAVNIGIFNLLPLPALDGGRLLFIFIEMIAKKPVPRKYEGWVHAVGFALLMVLMVVICFSDIMKLIKG